LPPAAFLYGKCGSGLQRLKAAAVLHCNGSGLAHDLHLPFDGGQPIAPNV
jgi:hypothetical protein